MGAMFSSPRIPQPAPLPESPIQAEVRQAERQRASAEAVTTAAASGRRTTMYAGQALAMEKQMARAKRRQAAATDLEAL